MGCRRMAQQLPTAKHAPRRKSSLVRPSDLIGTNCYTHQLHGMPSATIATITNHNSELHSPDVLQQQNATTRRAPVVARLTLHPESHWTGKHQSWLVMVVSLITKSCTFKRICVCAPLPPGHDGHVTFPRRSRSCEFPSGSRKLLGHHLSGARLRTQGPAADRLRKSLFRCFVNYMDHGPPLSAAGGSCY